jgi:hypothetical protein
MSSTKTSVPDTILNWHPIEEIPPLHAVQYAGENWLQSKPLVLINETGKMALGYCQQIENGCPQFEATASGESLRNICLWAIIRPPGVDASTNAESEFRHLRDTSSRCDKRNP